MTRAARGLPALPLGHHTFHIICTLRWQAPHGAWRRSLTWRGTPGPRSLPGPRRDAGTGPELPPAARRNSHAAHRGCVVRPRLRSPRGWRGTAPHSRATWGRRDSRTRACPPIPPSAANSLPVTSAMHCSRRISPTEPRAAQDHGCRRQRFRRWSGELRERLQRRRDLRAGEPEVPVAALRLDAHQSEGKQSRQMFARRGARDMDVVRQFTRRARRSIKQHGEHAGAAGVGDQRRDLGYAMSVLHVLSVAACGSGPFGSGRIIRCRAHGRVAT